ncbi:MAG: hypothetical protein ACTSW1_03155 [Candidatus Hodarchaeales archaeon]
MSQFKLENTPVVAVLHAYQPPTQEPAVLNRIVNNCYLPVTNVLLENPELKITLNINASLSEQLENKYQKLIENLCELASNKQVEFLESGAYHPILPMLSEKEIEFQIKLNNEINRRIFGSIWKPEGFWPPELAVSEFLAEIVERMGYNYMMVSEIAISSNSPFPMPLFTRLPVHPTAPKLGLINRNREVSNNISFRKYYTEENMFEHVTQLRQMQPEGWLIFASDLETFGEHHKRYYNFLFNVLKSMNAQTAKELLKLPKQPIVELRASSWSTSEEDLQRNIPYPLWDYPSNSIHELLNIHQDLLTKTKDYLLKHKSIEDPKVKKAMKNYAKAQYSCAAWWASTKDHFSKKLILDGFEAQQQTLKNLVEALGGNIENSIILDYSNKLGERLQERLSRIK